jgi:hypothetical protein
MTLFSQLISFINRELACAVDFVRQPLLSFKHDFSFYSNSIFADNFWISTGIVCLTIPCVKHESIFAIGFSRRSWILWRYQLHTSASAHITVAIPWVNCDPVFSFDFVRQPWISMHCRFHPSAVTQFQIWFLVLQWLSYRWRFLDQHWHCVFDDSMCQTWIYFCYWFLESVVNSLTLSTPYVSCHSYYSGDFRV